MATATYDIEIQSVESSSQDTVEVVLSVAARTSGDRVEMSPGFILRLLSDVVDFDGSDRPYHPPTFTPALTRYMAEMELLEYDDDRITVRARLSEELADSLYAGLSWESYHYATEWLTVVDLAVQENGKRIVCALTADEPQIFGTAMVRNLGSQGPGKITNWLHHPGIVAVEPAPRGWWTIGGGTVRLWTSTGSKLREEYPVEEELTSAVAVDGGLYVGARCGKLLDLTGEKTLLETGAKITALAANQDGWIAGTEAGTVWVTQGGEPTEMTLSDGPVTSVAIHEDARWLATTEGRGWLGVGDSIEEEKAITLSRDDQLPMAVERSLWEISSDLLIKSNYPSYAPTSIIEMLDMETGERTPLVAPFTLSGARISDDGSTILAFHYGGDTSEVAIWRDGDWVMQTSGPFELEMQYTTERMAISNDGRYVAVAQKGNGGEETFFHLFDSQIGQRQTLTNPGSHDWPKGMAFCGDRLFVAYANHSGTWWDPSTGEIVETLEQRAQKAMQRGDAFVTFFGNTKTEKDPTTNEWAWTSNRRAETFLAGQQVATFPLAEIYHKDSARSFPAHLSNDGEVVVVNELRSVAPDFRDEPIVTIWKKGEEPWLLDWEGQNGKVLQTELSPRGAFLVNDFEDQDSNEHRIDLWCIEDRQRILSLPVEDKFFGLSVTDDGDFMVMHMTSFVRYDKDGNEKLRVESEDSRQFPVRTSGAAWRDDKPLWLSHQIGAEDPLVLRATGAVAIPGKTRVIAWNQKRSPWVEGGLFLGP